uniref:Putative secreted protein n=1 Tax=Ixodes ricinus TaxID=34613 RepID=A0A6B0UF93_IXORI
MKGKENNKNMPPLFLLLFFFSAVDGFCVCLGGFRKCQLFCVAIGFCLLLKARKPANVHALFPPVSNVVKIENSFFYTLQSFCTVWFPWQPKLPRRYI